MPCPGRDALAIGPVRTVSSHLDRVRDKTGCRHAELARLALSTGLV
jgi:DNA-binding CsgD family transcriptional regulator